MSSWKPSEPENDRDAPASEETARDMRAGDGRDDRPTPSAGPRRRDFSARYIDARTDMDGDAAAPADRDPAAGASVETPRRRPDGRARGTGRLRAGLRGGDDAAIDAAIDAAVDAGDDPFADEIDAELNRRVSRAPETQTDAAPRARRRRPAPPSASRRHSAPIERLEPIDRGPRAESSLDRRSAARATRSPTPPHPRAPRLSRQDLSAADTRDMRWELGAPSHWTDAAAEPLFEARGDAAPFEPTREDELASIASATHGAYAEPSPRPIRARPAAIAGVTFAAAFAALASVGALEADISGAFSPMARIVGLAPSDAGRVADVPIDAGDLETPLGPSSQGVITAELEQGFPDTDAPSWAEDRFAEDRFAEDRVAQNWLAGDPLDNGALDGTDGLDTAAVETASISGYLTSEALSDLVSRAPVKCVLPTPARGGYGPSNLDGILETGQILCAETVDYRSEGALFTHRSRIDGEAILEINAPFSIKGDAICHQTGGLSALVIGDGVPLAQAVTLERVVKANYAATPGGEICYRLRPAFSRDGLIAYEADVFVEGRVSDERTDPRPFLMRSRS